MNTSDLIKERQGIHRSHRTGWLRASVLGANDGVVSVASLVVGVAAGGVDRQGILLAGVAGLVAGAMSMAAGEYVSVQSQADTENADLRKERRELDEEPELELAELTAIYVGRGLEESLARQVAERLTAMDSLESHSRDELGITDTFRARPIQAAFASSAAFVVGAFLPILSAVLAPVEFVGYATAATTLLALVALGAIAALAGGAPVVRGAIRVATWGALAMALTALAGKLVGTAV